MKRLRVFLFGNWLVADIRRPLVLLVTGFIVLAWLRSATAQPAENRTLMPEPMTASGGESTLEDPHWLEPELPGNHKRTTVTKSQDEDTQSPDSQPPQKPRRTAVARSHEEDAQSPDSQPPRKPKRMTVAMSHEEDAQSPDSQPPRKHKRTVVATSQEVDVDPPSDGPYDEEDDDTCRDRERCPCRPWGPGCCWQPFANRLEARGEWLYWWGKGNYVPPLVTTGPSTPASGLPGALGSTGTVDFVRQLRLERLGPQRRAHDVGLLADLRSYLGD